MRSSQGDRPSLLLQYKCMQQIINMYKLIHQKILIVNNFSHVYVFINNNKDTIKSYIHSYNFRNVRMSKKYLPL